MKVLHSREPVQPSTRRGDWNRCRRTADRRAAWRLGPAGEFLAGRPWEEIPPSDWLIAMTVRGEEGLERLVFVMGGGGEEFGVLVFPKLTEWRLHVHQAGSGTLPPAE